MSRGLTIIIIIITIIIISALPLAHEALVVRVCGVCFFVFFPPLVFVS